MNIVINWIRQNLVTLVEIVETVYDVLQLIVNAATRIVAITPSVTDDTYVAKIHNILAIGKPWIKKVKDFLLQRAG